MANFFTAAHEAYPDPIIEPIEGQVYSVSYSTMSTFEKCAHAVYLGKVKGIRGLGSAATDRGSKLHDMLEQYVLGNLNEVKWKSMKSHDYHAPIINSFADLFDEGLCTPELKVAFTNDMKPTKWDAKDMWLRGAIDVVVWKDKKKEAATIYDYKSGQDLYATQHRTQLMMYALLMFHLFPSLQSINSAALYLDLKKDPFYTQFTRDDVELLWPRMYERLNRVTDCRDFQPNPNGFSCKWCQHKKIIPELEQAEPACKFAHGA